MERHGSGGGGEVDVWEDSEDDGDLAKEGVAGPSDTRRKSAGSRHRRTSSINISPPAPPVDFNPPPEHPLDSPASTISPLTGGTPSLSANNSTSNLNLLDTDSLIRPQLQALQRLSTESPHTIHSGSSLSSISSDGGEHLAEMRQKLKYEGSRSQGESEDESVFDLQVSGPTPPMDPRDMEAGPSRRISFEDTQPSSEHAWDSVGTCHRSIPPDPGPSRFPIAPISPFITPAFSPAALPRRSISPTGLSRRQGKSPDTSNPNSEYFPLPRRLSITPNSPMLNSPKGHQRSQSNTSPITREMLDKSPPKRYDRLPGSSLKPSSPMNKQPTRFADFGTSPPSPSFMSRPRAQSMTGRSPGQSQIPRIDSPRPEPSPPAVPPDPIPASFPTLSLPPSIVPARLPPLAHGDDGTSSHFATITHPASPATSPTVPFFAPSARPAALRRAISDYDARTRIAPPGLSRSLSITADLDKSPKRPSSAAEVQSPVSPGFGQDPDITRVRKSPRKSPLVEPFAPRSASPPSPPTHDQLPDTPHPGSLVWRGPDPADHMGEINLVDEGDILPSSMDFQMDVTFDDEGLNTLERIFLLSKSEYPFHRAYVARVLGDLLNDVDPCESVEYVLPLLSGFSMDEDESVKESFASELHRILWYFFSSCRLVEDEDDEGEGEEVGGMPGIKHNPSTETVTITSQGVQVVDTPTEAEVAAVPEFSDKRWQSAISLALPAGPSSAGSSLAHRSNTGFSSTTEVTTPASTISETPSDVGTAVSPSAWVNPFADDTDPDKGWAKDIGPLVKSPILPVNFFTPLLGALLLNSNPTISDSVRSGLVSIVGRMRGKVEVDPDRWGMAAVGAEKDERRTFASQSGPHAHDLRPFNQQSRDLVENELINGIIVGMAHLSTDLPESLFDIAEDGEDGEGARLFQDQLIAEATAGRATSMNLIGAVCEFFGGEECVEKGFLGEVLRCWDGDVAVRAEGAVALSCIAKIAPGDWVDSMVDLFDHLANDETEHVRQSICLSLPALCRRIEDQDVKREFAVRAVLALSESGEEVRCALLEMMGEVIHSFESDTRGPPIELLRVYMDDYGMTGQDTDFDIVASFNFPGVCLTLGPERWDELRDLYNRLQSRAGEKVTRTLAASLHELAKILTPDQVERDLLLVYHKCLSGNDEVRERIYEHLDVIFSRVHPSTGWKLFIELAQAWKRGTLGGWRAREQLALHIPKFFEIFQSQGKSQDELTCISDMISDALRDPFAAVRNAATFGIPTTYTILGDGDNEDVAKGFRDMLLDMGNSSSYRQRVTFVKCLREFVKPPPNQRVFEEFFIPALPRLSQDVVDVRLALAQVVADLFIIGAFYGERAVPVPSALSQLADSLSNDDSSDIRDTVRNIDFDRLRKSKTSSGSSKDPARSKYVRPDFAPTRSRVTQSDLSENSTVKQGRGRTPERRPSGEVAARMGGMNLGMARPPMVESPMEEEESGVGDDPFSQSFAEATEE